MHQSFYFSSAVKGQKSIEWGGGGQSAPRGLMSRTGQPSGVQGAGLAGICTIHHKFQCSITHRKLVIITFEYSCFVSFYYLNRRAKNVVRTKLMGIIIICCDTDKLPVSKEVLRISVHASRHRRMVPRARFGPF